MNNMRKRRMKWGEGRLLAVALGLLLAFCALYALNRLPQIRTVQPVHAVETDLYDFVLIDVNSASAERLARLPGVGDVLAERIVADRVANGPFASLDDLLRVDGLGPAKLEALRPHARTS